MLTHRHGWRYGWHLSPAEVEGCGVVDTVRATTPALVVLVLLAVDTVVPARVDVVLRRCLTYAEVLLLLPPCPFGNSRAVDTFGIDSLQ